ncbi:MAG TPA: histidine--tRNA ligase [Acidobacteriota bacterium]|nr:histidine--tRNA ligase [Acidobacteriota bacterium]
MTKIITAPLSGMRDFLPQDVRRRRYVIDIVEQVYSSYGFEPLETPVMERLETLLGKYGEEGDQLIFRVLKRGAKLEQVLGGRPGENDLADAGLRYDLTVPLARVVAEYRAQLPRVFKRYQIQPVFRADRPAKGRFREFCQCDVDVVGIRSVSAECEILSAGAEVLCKLGFEPGEDFVIRLNHRRLLRSLAKHAGIPPFQEEAALVAVDKLDKIGVEGVAEELHSRGIPQEASDRLLEWLRSTPDVPAEVHAGLEEILGGSADGETALAELARILKLAAAGPAGPALRLDPWLARGLSYYTGPIFEVEIRGFAGSAGGGGRYDDLVGMFCGEQIPACGFSLGLERLLLILEERNLFPSGLEDGPQVLVTLFSDELALDSFRLAQDLRRQGFRVDVFPEPGRYGKQFRYAEQRGIRIAALLGPEEKARGTVILRDLARREQEEVSAAGVGDWLRSRLTGDLES